MIGIASSARSIRMPWKKSVQQTALNPPRNVYPTMMSAKRSIAVLPGMFGKSMVNTEVPATNADATYTVNAIRKMIAQMICSALLLVANLLVRY